MDDFDADFAQSLQKRIADLGLDVDQEAIVSLVGKVGHKIGDGECNRVASRNLQPVDEPRVELSLNGRAGLLLAYQRVDLCECRRRNAGGDLLPIL